jgi:hypothetical protein
MDNDTFFNLVKEKVENFVGVLKTDNEQIPAIFFNYSEETGYNLGLEVIVKPAKSMTLPNGAGFSEFNIFFVHLLQHYGGERTIFDAEAELKKLPYAFESRELENVEKLINIKEARIMRFTMLACRC